MGCGGVRATVGGSSRVRRRLGLGSGSCGDSGCGGFGSFTFLAIDARVDSALTTGVVLTVGDGGGEPATTLALLLLVPTMLTTTLI